MLAALAVLVGAEQGNVTSRHVEADTTWSVPVDATAGVMPQDTTWSVSAGATVAGGVKVQPADTTW
ncbi:hypothetical protein ACWCQN_25185 [Streptomyces sp. NPDC001984]